ncbi:hypothetical protein NKH18_01360 [Streptomyces sp. M10(2022)]
MRNVQLEWLALEVLAELPDAGARAEVEELSPQWPTAASSGRRRVARSAWTSSGPGAGCPSSPTSTASRSVTSGGAELG